MIFKHGIKKVTPKGCILRKWLHVYSSLWIQSAIERLTFNGHSMSKRYMNIMQAHFNGCRPLKLTERYSHFLNSTRLQVKLTGNMDIVSISEKQHDGFINLTGDMGLKIVSDMRPGYFSLVTGDTAVFWRQGDGTGAFLKI